ncbi:hypothetical protein ACFQ2B_13840 [Streptomyces stramineus]
MRPDRRTSWGLSTKIPDDPRRGWLVLYPCGTLSAEEINRISLPEVAVPKILAFTFAEPTELRRRLRSDHLTLLAQAGACA